MPLHAISRKQRSVLRQLEEKTMRYTKYNPTDLRLAREAIAAVGTINFAVEIFRPDAMMLNDHDGFLDLCPDGDIGLAINAMNGVRTINRAKGKFGNLLTIEVDEDVGTVSVRAAPELLR